MNSRPIELREQLADLVVELSDGALRLCVQLECDLLEIRMGGASLAALQPNEALDDV